MGKIKYLHLLIFASFSLLDLFRLTKTGVEPIISLIVMCSDTLLGSRVLNRSRSENDVI